MGGSGLTSAAEEVVEMVQGAVQVRRQRRPATLLLTMTSVSCQREKVAIDMEVAEGETLAEGARPHRQHVPPREHIWSDIRFKISSCSRHMHPKEAHERVRFVLDPCRLPRRRSPHPPRDANVCDAPPERQHVHIDARDLLQKGRQARLRPDHRPVLRQEHKVPQRDELL